MNHYHKPVEAKTPDMEAKAIKQEMKVLAIFKTKNRPLARWEVYQIYTLLYGHTKEHSIVRAISNLLNGSPKYIEPFDKVIGDSGVKVNRWSLIKQYEAGQQINLI